MTAFVALTATALIMGGTGHPLSTPQDSPEFINSYTTDANNDYIVLTGFCGADACTPTAVSTPEQFMPVSGTMPFDQSVGAGVTQPRPGDQCATGRRVDGRVRLLAERTNRIDRERQSRRGGLDAAVVVRVDRQPEPTQRRHPATFRGRRDPHSRESLSTVPRPPTPTLRPSTSPASTTAGPISPTTRSTRSPRRMRLRASTICTATTRASVLATRCIRARTATPTTT